MYKVISKSNQSIADSITWFVGTKKQCEQVLPRIKRWARKTSDEFEIVRDTAQ